MSAVSHFQFVTLKTNLSLKFRLKKRIKMGRIFRFLWLEISIMIVAKCMFFNSLQKFVVWRKELFKHFYNYLNYLTF